MEEISKSLSGADIKSKVNCNLLQYSDLHKYNSIDDILGSHKKCVLLYHTSANYGHWVCIYEYKGTTFFFDSYGSIPDSQLKFLNKDLKEELNSEHRHLTELLYRSNRPVEYNQHQFQKREPNIATCGRHCIVRLKYPEISIEEYHQIFKQSSRYIDLDELVCLLIPF